MMLKFTRRFGLLSLKPLASCVQASRRRFCTSTSRSSSSSSQGESVDASEMRHFSNIKDWWQSGSEMAPLYAYNFARVDFMREFMKDFNSEGGGYQHSKPFNNLAVIDVGCGGGLLTESLCRLGANVTGLDANENSIEIARAHMNLDPTLKQEKLQYKLSTAEELVAEGAQFDVVSCLEVIEHVTDKQAFVSSLTKLVKIGGMLFLSTMEKNTESYLKLIIGAEYLLGLVPKGTHDWQKFIDASALTTIVEANGCKVIRVQGFAYNPVTCTMERAKNNMNYVLAAIRVGG